MCQLIESIKIKDGIIFNLDLHQKRFEKSREKLFNLKNDLQLNSHINIPKIYQNGLIKCRVVYNEKIQGVEYAFYQKKSIQNLKIVHDDSIDYHLKYSDREAIKNLYSKKEDCDDVLIIKNGFLTDTSYCNVVLETKKGDLFTPKNPLLRGVQRQLLLNQGRIKEADILLTDLYLYERIYLINALLEIGEIIIDIKNIY